MNAVTPRFKVKPLRDPKHLAYIRTLRCCLCNAPPPSEAAHLRLGGAGGTGAKPGDDLTVPLCRSCHRAETVTGPPAFWRMWLAHDDVMVARAMSAYARSLRP